MSICTSHSALSVPLLREIEVDADQLKRISRIDRLGNLAPKNITVDTFLPRLAARVNADKVLSRETLWEVCSELRSLITQRQLLLIGLVPTKEVAALRDFFGVDKTSCPDSFAPHATGAPLLEVIGPEIIPEQEPGIRELFSQLAVEFCGTAQMNQPHVPLALNPSAWNQSWCQGSPPQLELVLAAFAGVDSVTISTKNYAALRECGAHMIPSSLPDRMLRSPKFWAYAIVFIYSTLRALPLVFVKHFQGSVLLLWSMDVITAIPYTWGLLAFVTAHRAWERYLGLLVTLVTFVTPYVYFWSHGRNYPALVNLVAITMILAAIAWETRNYLRDKAVIRGLTQRV